MYVIALSHGKGGVAKTTTVISLGAALTEHMKRVLLIDLDPQAGMAPLLGLGMSPPQRSIAQVFYDSASIERVIRHTDVPGMDIVPSSHELSMAEQYLPLHHNYQYQLRRILREVEPIYDFVLLDCPPFLGAVALNAIVAAHMLIIPTLPEMLSVAGMHHMREWVINAKIDNNPYLIYRILITMYGKRNRARIELAEKLREKLGEELFETVIGVDNKVRESQILGKPVLVHAKNSRASLQYRALAQEVLNYVERKS